MIYKNVTINEVPYFKMVYYYTLFQDLRERTDINEYCWVMQHGCDGLQVSNAFWLPTAGM